MTTSFVSSATALLPAAPRDMICVTTPAGVLVVDVDGVTRMPTRAEVSQLGLGPDAMQYLGRLGDADCWAAAATVDVDVSNGLTARSLRALAMVLPAAEFAVAGRAVQILQWVETHRFCGRCGTPTEHVARERAFRCPKCTLTAYPRLSPAVIVAVHRPGELLLARAANFPAAFHSVLAGFVEPGESLEETIVREIREEVGIEVGIPRYFGSQPWPFPNSLMLAFDVAWASGELRADGVEILEAAWYRKDALPQIPPSISIARRLIDAWCAGNFG